MPNLTKTFAKSSDNEIKVTLKEDGTGIAGAWDQVDIDLYDMRQGSVVSITRTTAENGVTLNTGTGLLTITPGDLVESLAALVAHNLYRVIIEVTTATEPNGVYFGDAGTLDSKLYFYVTDPQ